MASDYEAFLAGKAEIAPMTGIAADVVLRGHLFPFQSHCVRFALRAGSSGLFLDTGLGKTECQLEWCDHAMRATNGRSLILTPLAVAKQTKRRADRWGYEARVIREQSEARDGINICNYERVDKLDVDDYGAVVLDESSILKSFTGKVSRGLIDLFQDHQFRLSATATPAPNDLMEMGTQSEFLGVLRSNEMLSRFFINDTSQASQHWRLKGHAADSFWAWVTSWARLASLPSDLGDVDDGFILRPFDVIRHRAKDSRINREFADLFGAASISAANLHNIKRQTARARAEIAAQIIEADPLEPWLIWCDTNYEADELRAVIAEAIEIRGSMSLDTKEDGLEAFATGGAKRLIAKPSMCGFGLDWSHCARMIFVGRSFSYETWYQAVRRAWRFGQHRNVQVHLVVAEGEAEIGRVIDRKADDGATMRTEMREAMRRATIAEVSTRAVSYKPTHEGRMPAWMQSAV